MTLPSGSNPFSSSQYSPGFINGMQTVYLNPTALAATSGNCIDSTNNVNIPLDFETILNFSNIGVNGIDAGAIGNNQTWYIYSITSSLNKTQQGVLASLSSTSPILPSGYDSFRMIDYQITNGSAQLLKNLTFGNGNKRTKYWDSGISVLSSGTATSLTAVNLSGACPLGISGISVDLFVSFTPAAAGNTVGIAPFGSTATSISKLGSTVISVAQNSTIPNIPVVLDSDVPKILYINSAASCSTTLLVGNVNFEI